MSKSEFLARLRKGLKGLPKTDIEERLAFYSEIIDDKMEDGLAEETAVLQIGTAEEIVAQIIADTPLTTLLKEKINHRKRLKTWEIVLLSAGSPIWFPLLIALIAVIFSLYISIWAVIVSLWAVFVSVVASTLGCIMSGVGFICFGEKLSGIALISVGFICAGLSIFLSFGCKTVTKGILQFTKKQVLSFKKAFLNRRAQNDE